MAKIVLNDGREVVLLNLKVKAAGAVLRIRPDEYGDLDSLLEIWRTGAGRIYQDKANSAAGRAKDDGAPWTDEEKAAYALGLHKAHKEAAFGDGRGGDPVEAKAFELVESALLDHFGAKRENLTDGEGGAVESTTGEPFWRMTEKGRVVRVRRAFLAFIDRQVDAVGVDYMAQAQAIIDAEKGVKGVKIAL